MEGVEFVNLTPHEIKIVGEDGEIKLVIPPSGKLARVSTKQVKVGEVNGIPIVKTEFGEVVVAGKDGNTTKFNDGETFICNNCKHFINNFGECAGALVKNVEYCEHQEPIDYYIVSSLVAQAVKGRNDVVSPDTSPASAVRDENGNIIGVKRFQRW